MYNEWVTGADSCQLARRSVAAGNQGVAVAPEALRPEGRLEDVEKVVRQLQQNVVEIVEWLDDISKAIEALGGVVPTSTDASSENHYGEYGGMSWLDSAAHQ